MTRDEMLNTLHSLRFCVFWPGNWKDIGFTERPIWVNAHGYGYYFDDEPCGFISVDGVNDELLQCVKSKAASGELTADDLKGTPFEELDEYSEDQIEYHFDDLIALPEHCNGSIFGGLTSDGWLFFASEEELIDAFDGNTGYDDTLWESMDDRYLAEWIDRLF